MKRYMLVGSGADAHVCNEMDLRGFTVCAINHAWRVPARLDVHIYAGDWLPRGADYPAAGTHKRISFREYDSKRQHLLFGGQEVGIGATMFFNAAYWILGQMDWVMESYEIYFAGCSMDYPAGEANTFYGGGAADPLRFGPDRLREWFLLFGELCAKRDVRLINLGSKSGLMPW
jgi:hypothetical protein